jgi:regulatory protein
MTPRPAREPADPDSSQAAHLVGLRWLAVRELSERQVRDRLARRGFSATAIEPAIERLTRARALDDRRAALAAAHTDVNVHHRGPARVRRRLHEMGIDRDLAHDIVREVFGDLDDRDLMERALARRLRTGAGSIRDPAQRRRLHAYLVRQGFSASAAATLLRSRSRRSALPDDE